MKLNDYMPEITKGLAEGKRVKFFPNGRSMKPMLYGKRDSVILSSPPKKLKKYDLPLYRRKDGSYCLHRVVKVGENYTCLGDNTYQKEYNISHCSVIGVVVAFERKGKRIKATNPLYKTYCILWCSLFPVRKLINNFRCWLKRK